MTRTHKGKRPFRDRRKRTPRTNDDLARDARLYASDVKQLDMDPLAAVQMAYRDGYRTALADYPKGGSTISPARRKD